MTPLEQLNARLAELRTAIEGLAERNTGVFSDEEQRWWDWLNAEFDHLNGQRQALEAREQRRVQVRKVAIAAPTQIERGSSPDAMDSDPIGDPASIRGAGRQNPWQVPGPLETVPRSELRSRAYDAIERMSGSTQGRREAATQMMERWDDERKGFPIARHIMLTSSPEYLRAFSKVVFGGNGHDLTESERVALARAMSLTDNAGGYMIPFQLDPTLILTADGSVNPFRQISRVVVATGDEWHGFSAGNVSWSYDGEASAASDDAPAFAQPTIPIKKGVGYVPISEEALADEPNVAEVVALLLAGGKDDLEATAFATGSGAGNNPTGIVTALTGTASEIDTATADTFAIADVYSMEQGPAARYRARASWVANWKIFNLIRQFGTSDGHALWDRLAADQPERLLGRPRYESSAMDGTINAAANNYILVFGDFQYYVIADRLGMTIEYIPHIFDQATGRPTGQRGWRAIVRHGADSVNDGAFRLLDA